MSDLNSPVPENKGQLQSSLSERFDYAGYISNAIELVEQYIVPGTIASLTTGVTPS
jgi:hypothetical protein